MTRDTRRVADRRRADMSAVYGLLARFTVPVSVDPEKIAANYREGVLSVILPKKPEAAPRKITVRVS